MCHYLLVDSHVPFPSHSLVLLVSPLAYASHLFSLSFSHTLIYCNNTNLKPTPTICSPLRTHTHHPSRAHSIIYLPYLLLFSTLPPSNSNPKSYLFFFGSRTLLPYNPPSSSSSPFFIYYSFFWAWLSWWHFRRPPCLFLNPLNPFLVTCCVYKSNLVCPCACRENSFFWYLDFCEHFRASNSFCRLSSVLPFVFLLELSFWHPAFSVNYDYDIWAFGVGVVLLWHPFFYFDSIV